MVRGVTPRRGDTFVPIRVQHVPRTSTPHVPKRLCIEEYLKSLQVAGVSVEPERAGAAAAPAVQVKPRRSHYFTKYVCFAEGESDLIEGVAAAGHWPKHADTPRRHYYSEKDIDGIRENKDGVVTVRKLPMSEVVKAPRGYVDIRGQRAWDWFGQVAEEVESCMSNRPKMGR